MSTGVEPCMASRGYEAASLARIIITRVLQIADDSEIDMATRNELADIGNGLGMLETRIDELRSFIESGKRESTQ